MNEIKACVAGLRFWASGLFGGEPPMLDPVNPVHVCHDGTEGRSKGQLEVALLRE
jgi:hypothetical protein